MTPRAQQARDALLDRLNMIANSPCLLKCNSAYIGPFANFDEASKYRSEQHIDAGIHTLIPPTDNPDWSIANELAG